MIQIQCKMFRLIKDKITQVWLLDEAHLKWGTWFGSLDDQYWIGGVLQVWKVSWMIDWWQIWKVS